MSKSEAKIKGNGKFDNLWLHCIPIGGGRRRTGRKRSIIQEVSGGELREKNEFSFGSSI